MYIFICIYIVVLYTCVYTSYIICDTRTPGAPSELRKEGADLRRERPELHLSSGSTGGSRLSPREQTMTGSLFVPFKRPWRGRDWSLECRGA